VQLGLFPVIPAKALGLTQGHELIRMAGIQASDVVIKMNILIKASVEFVLLLLVYGLCIALTSFLWAHPALLTGCYVLVSVLTLLKWHTRADVVAYAAAAVLGPLGEAVAVHYGAWTYTKPSLLIPLWLPLLWGVAGLFLRRITWIMS
jgi:hypothetical protein